MIAEIFYYNVHLGSVSVTNYSFIKIILVGDRFQPTAAEGKRALYPFLHKPTCTSSDDGRAGQKVGRNGYCSKNTVKFYVHVLCTFVQLVPRVNYYI